MLCMVVPTTACFFFLKLKVFLKNSSFLFKSELTNLLNLFFAQYIVSWEAAIKSAEETFLPRHRSLVVQ